MSKIIIVGGVAGGAAAAARLRRLDENAEIVMFEKGPFISFANCGLPYYIGDVIHTEDELLIQTPEAFRDRFNVDVRVNHEVLSIDRANREVTFVDDAGNTHTETYDKLILSPGARPFVPSTYRKLQGPNVFTLRTVPDAVAIRSYVDKHQPRKAVIIGGGAIGLEMAENLVEAGCDVTIIERGSHVLPTFDTEMTADMQNYLRQKGVHLLTDTDVVSAKSGQPVQLGTDYGAIDADILIIACGVKPESDLAAAAGLELTPAGAISVNSFMQTSDPDIYALGDAVETEYLGLGRRKTVALAGPATKQARVAVNHIAGRPEPYAGTQGSSILKFFDMAAASTGLTERECKGAQIPCAKSYTYAPSHVTYYPGGGYMSIKTIYDPESGKILGAQIVGFGEVDKSIDKLAIAVRSGLTADDLAEMELSYSPPYSSAKDPVNMAGFVIQNEMDGLVQDFFWDEVDDLPRDGSIQLVDVRTPKEVGHGTIADFISIPLEELRSRLTELDPEKPVYITCESGLRGYIACRILAQRGFDCKNLSGGYRLWEAVQRDKMTHSNNGAASK